MVTIRTTQLDVFQKEMDNRFLLSLLNKLRSECPGETAEISDEAMIRDMEQGLLAARGFGMEDVRDVTAFIHLGIAVGKDFYRHAQAEEILSDQFLTPSERMDMLLEWIVAYDPGESCSST